MPTCDMCGGFTLGTSNICAMCANTANGRRIGVAGQNQYRPVVPQLPPVYVVPTYQLRQTIQSTAGGLGPYLAAWVPTMVTWLGVRNYWGAQAVTGFGDQATPNGCTNGTRSLDFQGIRAGLNGVFWIDIQAQFGGGGTPRNTHAQVLIQCTGHPVSAQAIIAALNGSLGQGRRALLHIAGGAASAP